MAASMRGVRSRESLKLGSARPWMSACGVRDSDFHDDGDDKLRRAAA